MEEGRRATAPAVRGRTQVFNWASWTAQGVGREPWSVWYGKIFPWDHWGGWLSLDGSAGYLWTDERGEGGGWKPWVDRVTLSISHQLSKRKLFSRVSKASTDRHVRGHGDDLGVSTWHFSGITGGWEWLHLTVEHILWVTLGNSQPI